MSESNYQRAVNLLKERFGQEQVLLNAHIDALLKISPATNDVKKLRSLYDACEGYTHGLESLGVYPESYGDLLIPIVMKKLPEETLRIMLRSHDETAWTLADLRKQLRHEVETREKSSLGQSDKEVSVVNPPFNSRFSTAGALFFGALGRENAKNGCTFCDGPHPSDSCKIVPTIGQGLEFLRNQKRCFRCVKKGHISKSCYSKKRCPRCNGKRHSTLCQSPDEWKVANVVPVYKKGRKDCVENYRPISLLPLISKVLERCVLARVSDHLYHFISPAQHGFLPGRSCVTQLLTALDQIGAHLDTGKQTDVIYLDMSKAFDKVCQSLLLRILKQCNVAGHLLDWFNAYLTNRKQRVTVSAESSTEVLVSSGVPQGSLLGPLLFLLFVNNLPDRCSSSNVACFADETKIYKLIDSLDDSKALQSDLDSLVFITIPLTRSKTRSFAIWH